VTRHRAPLLCIFALVFGVPAAFHPQAQAPTPSPSQASKSQPDALSETISDATETATAVVEGSGAKRIIGLLAAIEEGLDYIPGEVLVKFKDGVGPTAVASVLSLARPRNDAREVRWIGNLAVVAIDEGEVVPAVAERLSLEREVEYAQPNYFTALHSTPNDPGLNRQWNLTAIDLPAAWDMNPGAPEVLVAVVDSGVTTTTAAVSFHLWLGRRFAVVTVPFAVNPDLDAARIVDSIDTTPSKLTYRGFAPQPVFDTQGHGTHVAATIGQATNNSFGFAGVAYASRLLVAKACMSYWDIQLYQSALGIPGFVSQDLAEGVCDTASVVAGIRWAADKGARVINVSIGGPRESTAYRDALSYAVQRGAFVSIAAGNDFEDGNPTNYPAAYGPQISGAMTVGAVGLSLRRATYSSTGSYVEIAAPGGDWEDGEDGLIHQWGLAGGFFDPATVVVPRFDLYRDHPSAGTSMAAPHIAGVAGLLYTQGITNPAAIEEAIKRFARPVDGTPDEVGAGLVDARRALRGLGLAR
jgi:serine protease